MNSAEQFLRWWLARLGELLPRATGSRQGSRRKTLSLVFDRGDIRIGSPGREQTIELAAGDGALSEPQRSSLRAAAPRVIEHVEIQLSAGDYLHKQLTVPRAAHDHLAETVSYQLPQLTPFNAEQLLYACGDIPGQAADDKLSAWLVAVPRQRVARVLEALGQMPPANPLALRDPPAPGEPLLLSWRADGERHSATTRPLLAWGLLGIMLLAVTTLHLRNLLSAEATLDEELDELRQQAAQVLAVRDRIDKRRGQADWLSGKLSTRVTPLALLDSLTRRISDETWIQRMELRGDKLTLVGFSPAPATLIETLENTPLLENVRFQAAITRDARGKGDRFNVSAQVRPGMVDTES